MLISSDQAIIDQYDKYFLAVMNGLPDADQNLLTFLSDNKQAVLTAMKDIGYAPSCGDQDPETDLNALMAALQKSIPDAISEFGQDVNSWMGMKCVQREDQFYDTPITPEDISYAFLKILNSFEKDPTDFASSIQWLLSSSYVKVLSTCSQDPNAFLKMASLAEAAAKNYEEHPTPSNLQELQNFVANLSPLLP